MRSSAIQIDDRMFDPAGALRRHVLRRIAFASGVAVFTGAAIAGVMLIATHGGFGR